MSLQIVSDVDRKKITVSSFGCNANVGAAEVEHATRLLHTPALSVRMLLVSLEVNAAATRDVCAAACAAGAQVALKASPLSATNLTDARSLISSGTVHTLFVTTYACAHAHMHPCTAPSTPSS